jgi:hypothetical protein
MSVNTTADERLDRICENLKQVNLDLVKWFVDDDVWGRGDYSDDFEDRLQEAVSLIRKARKLLG